MGSRCYPLLPQSLTFRRKMEKPRERKNLYLVVNKFSEKEGPTSFLDKGAALFISGRRPPPSAVD